MQLSHTTTKTDTCEGCPAPCCRMQQIPHSRPEFMALVDWTRYFLLFPGTELVIKSDGTFMFIRWQQCSMFLADKCTCSVHNTPQQPQICKSFSAHNCWYKRNFVTEEPADICRLNVERYERWMEHLSIDNNGRVIAYPDFETTIALTRWDPLESTCRHASLSIL